MSDHDDNETLEGLTHLDERGRASMVDVSEKDVTRRVAVARGFVYMSAETLEAIRGGELKKGEALQVARIAGIMAAKRTDDLIPLCHGLPLDRVEVEFAFLPDQPAICVRAEARCNAKTGVEMEALTAVSIASMTLYDMAKGIDRGMHVGDVHLVRKEGGRSGLFEHPDPPGPPVSEETPWE